MISSALVTFSTDLLVLLLILLLTSIKISVHSASSSDDKNESASLGLHIVVLTQNFPYEFERANKLHNDLWNQVESENKNKIELTLFHGLSREFDGAKIPKDTKSQENGNLLLQGFWAIWPILKRLDIRLRAAKWTLFLSPYTRLTHGVQPLIEHFLHYNHSEARFIGTAFFDESPVIIHHYHNGFITGLDGKQKSFLYPDIFSSAGFALSNGLLQQLLVHLEEGGKSGGSEKESKKRRRRIGPNFAIDPGFELAQLIFESSDATLENDPIFCIASQKQEKDESKCLLEFEAPDFLECDEAGAVLANSKKESIAGNGQLAYYAVKTHVGNHQTRVPVIQNTWANLLAADHQIGYFSDAEAINIPTIDLGVQNTERGHCGKTFAILRYFLGNPTTEYFRWLVLADDDTLFSVPRLQHFLRCLPQDQPVIAGQRYGYGFSVDGTDGYDYPTGGAGIVFSRSAVEMLTQNCVCPSLNSPDDMIIGLCARRLDIPIIHSAAFHQARPIDYSKEVIQRIWAGKHISFHKFEELDPLEVFQELLQENPQKHEEVEAHEEF